MKKGAVDLRVQQMIHRGTTRESKGLRSRRPSTPSKKLRRHRNKARIWRRCVKRLSHLIEETPLPLVEGVLLSDPSPHTPALDAVLSVTL
jgi:hypothetical protein